MELYLTFEMDLVTMGCFLEHHEMQLAPRKIQNLIVLHLLVGCLTQSTSQKSIMKEAFLLNNEHHNV